MRVNDKVFVWRFSIEADLSMRGFSQVLGGVLGRKHLYERCNLHQACVRVYQGR